MIQDDAENMVRLGYITFPSCSKYQSLLYLLLTSKGSRILLSFAIASSFSFNCITKYVHFTTVSVVVAPPDGKMQKLPEVHNRVSQKIGFLSWLTILGIWYPKYYISLKHDISYQTRALWPPQNFVDNFGSRRRTTSTLVSNWPRCVPAAKTGTHLKRTLTQILNIEF